VRARGKGAPGRRLCAAGAGSRARARAAAAIALLACAALLAGAAAAAASTYEWSAGEGAAAWSDGSNWAGGVAPHASEGPVDLVFGLGACETGARACAQTRDDVPALAVGTLTLASRLIASEPPAGAPPAAAYSVGGATPLSLSGGIDSPATVEGSGQVLAAAAPVISVPLLLTAPNTWTVGPAPGSGLDVLGPVTGPEPLAVSLAPSARLVLGGETEVGPVTIRGSDSSAVSLGEGAGDLNGRDASPVTLIGASLERAAGTVGPLTARAAALRLGGPLEVAGAAALLEGTRVSYDLPAPAGAAPEQLLARGRVNLGGAQLTVYEGCPAIGSTYTLVRSAGGVSGLLTGEAGEPLLPGDTLAGSQSGCGPGAPGAYLRIEYGPEAVALTAVSGPGGAPSGTAAGPPAPSSTGVAAYTAAQRSLLARVLARARSLRRHALLRHRRARLAVSVPTAGTLTLTWTARVRRHGVTVAFGRVRLGAAGANAARAYSGVIVVHLTAAGRRLLARHRRLATRIRETFAGAIVPRYAASAAAVLRR
jgi:hypothetical protein